MAQWPQTQEVHLVGGNGQPARELQPQLVVTQQGLPAPVVAPPAEAESEQDQRMRWRVVFVSALIAVYVVINALVSYLFDMAALQDALETVREVTHFRGGPSVTALVLNMVPSVGSAISIGLVVPFCGYLGVKQSQKWLIGCFCGCNAVHCCCGIISIVCLFFFSLGAESLAPQIELFLEKCDPAQCKYRPDGTTADVDHIVDCLAAGVWKDYQPRFGERLPHQCPPVFLTCGDKSEGTAKLVDDEDPFQQHDVYGMLPEEPHGGLRRLRFWSDKASMAERDSRMSKRVAEFRGQPSFPLEKPENPIKQCKPTKAVDRFHEIRLLLPALLPKLQLFILVRSFLLLPVVIFGCLGFCFGKDLFSRLSLGYNPVGTSQFNQHPQVMLIPALGVTAAVPTVVPGPAQMQTAPPLILQVPPSPLQATTMNVLSSAGGAPPGAF